MHPGLEGQNHLWSIILAGGEGKRTRPFIRRWLGRPKPKQYCAFVGTRSMLQHTVDRADQLTSSAQRIIVTKQAHDRRGWLQLPNCPLGTVIRQPCDRGTAAGIFLPLTYVRTRDPGATVVIYPSDHFIYPEEPFLDSVRRAVRAVEILPDHLVLLGVAPNKLDPEYGWIWPKLKQNFSDGMAVHLVERFQEKPDPQQASAAMASGALWNTFVFAAKVQTLWELGWRHLPQIMPLFEQMGYGIGLPMESAMVDRIYRVMPVRNFSSDLLAHAADQIATVEMKGVVWSDWGKPKRIADTVVRLGIKPAFPFKCLAPRRFAAP
jgi:mannose-1-phosphate guanylyltransferase